MPKSIHIYIVHTTLYMECEKMDWKGSCCKDKAGGEIEGAARTK
jgi:hypothetical protein